MDATWVSLADRLAGIDVDEYLWEPVPRCWTVRQHGTAWHCDWADPDPVPAPVTTIAWRCWHVAVDSLDSYSARRFGHTGSSFAGREWTPDPAEAMEEMRAAWAVFRGGVSELSGDRIHEPLGPSWGPFADRTTLDLVFHALREVTHHGAEIALLRDLYGARGGGGLQL